MDQVKVIQIFTAENNMQAEMILEAFKDSHIPAFKRDADEGGFMNVYSGNSFCGEKIYVAEKDADAAEEVLRDMGLMA